MAGIRFASGSTTTMRSERASRSIIRLPKISLVPTAKTFQTQMAEEPRQNQGIEIALVIGRDNIRTTLRELFNSPHIQMKTVERDHICQPRDQIPECGGDGLRTRQLDHVVGIRLLRQNRFPPGECMARSLAHRRRLRRFAKRHPRHPAPYKFQRACDSSTSPPSFSSRWQATRRAASSRARGRAPDCGWVEGSQAPTVPTRARSGERAGRRADRACRGSSAVSGCSSGQC